MQVKVVKKHPLVMRWNHWINFPVLTIMIWSGFLIYWANPAYFIPGEWLDAIGFNYKLAQGMAWHFLFGLIFTINGICYVSYLIYSGHWQYLFPDLSSWKDALLVSLHDFKIYKGPLPPQVKYNGAQRITYSLILIFGLVAAATGFAIYKPVQLNFLLQIFGGYRSARLIHFLMVWAFMGFFVVHIVQVIRSGWNNFRAMITGLEKIDEP